MNFDVFIKGNIVDLIVLTEGMVQNTTWYKWFNDEENTKYMQQHYFPNSKELQLEFFRNEIEGSTKKLQLGIYHKKDKILIGTISLNDINFQHGKCEIAGLIGEKKYQTVQPFAEANKLLIKHAFDQLNMNKIRGGTLNKDVATFFIRILGFKEEGVLVNDVYKNGHWNNVYLIGLLKEDYK
jgi:[ribosomal protein S5]-alanine N-acetyltransferase